MISLASTRDELRSGAYMAIVGMKGDKYEFYRYRQNKVDNIINVTCDWFQKSFSDLQKSSRKREYLEPRQICMYLLKRNTGLTLKQIAFMFGGRDHATVLHAIQMIKKLMETEPKLRYTVNALETKIL